MTRINCVPVKELTRKHLIAEYKELPRVFTYVRAAQKRGEMPESYLEKFPNYKMGRGHVSFFYPRLMYCVKRWYALRSEMIRRGYKPNYHSLDKKIEGVDNDWFGKWTPEQKDIDINRSRIHERLASSETTSAAQAAKDR